MKTEPAPPMKKPRPPAWFARLSRPVQILVADKMQAAGFEDDPDAWIADILTTARHSPQGYVLRLSMTRQQAAEFSKAAIVDTDLFNPPPSVPTLPAKTEL